MKITNRFNTLFYLITSFNWAVLWDLPCGDTKFSLIESFYQQVITWLKYIFISITIYTYSINMSVCVYLCLCCWSVLAIIPIAIIGS